MANTNQAPNPATCGLSLREHVNKVFLALMLAGLGGGCEGTYQALMEVAEVVRREQNFATYTPTMTEQIFKEIEEAEKQAQAEAALEASLRGAKVGRA